MEQIIEVNVPAPVVPSGMRKGQVITLNNLSRIHWASLSKAKNQFKQALQGWFLPRNEGEAYQSLTIVIKPLRHTRMRYDVSNTALAVKWLEDSLTDLGWVDDDCRNTIILEPAEYVEGLNETMLKIRVKGSR